jgi:hypothetical protein
VKSARRRARGGDSDRTDNGELANMQGTAGKKWWL